jgi:hypothetical protein
VSYGNSNPKENTNMAERKSVRTLDHIGTLLDTGDCHVVLVDGANVQVEEGEVVGLDEIETKEYEVAHVQRAADLVKKFPELRLVVLINPECGAIVPHFPPRRDPESPEGERLVRSRIH